MRSSPTVTVALTIIDTLNSTSARHALLLSVLLVNRVLLSRCSTVGTLHMASCDGAFTLLSKASMNSSEATALYRATVVLYIERVLA